MVHYVIRFGVLLVCVASVAAAQPFPMGDERPSEKLEQFKKVRLIELLDMNEEQSVRFFARLNEHENAKRVLMKEKMELLDRVEKLVRGDADQKAFEEIFPEVAAITTKIQQHDHEFFAGLSDVLTATQRGKFLLFERHFERELREAMREIQKRRRQRQ
jgi:Spy/CpxP family protein refolding chaperone